MKKLPIKSGQGNYEAVFVDKLDEIVESVLGIPDGVVVMDRRIAELYRAPLAEVLKQKRVMLVDAIEAEKTLDGVSRVASWLQSQKCNKRSQVIAFGGGIIQDLVTFVCHLYYRGVRWVYVPTTLLSMSDSCIGAKCGINLNSLKNQLGCFHSPWRVLIASDFVDTLSDADVVSGYGEILKLMLTDGSEQYGALEAAVNRHGLRNSQLPDFIFQSLSAKKTVIEQDEYESDLRRILNYGHTFGHSLESLTQYAVPHGTAVAWGLDLVNFIAWRRQLLDGATFRRVHGFVRKHLRVTVPRNVNAGALIEGVRHDKKSSSDAVDLILLEKIGRLKIVRTPFDRKLEEDVSSFLNLAD